MSSNEVGTLRTVLIGSVGTGWQSQDMDDNSWARAYCKNTGGKYPFFHHFPVYDFYKDGKAARYQLQAIKDYLKRDGINVLTIDEPNLEEVTPQPGIYKGSECLPFNAGNVRDPFIMIGDTLVASRSTRGGTTHIPDWYLPVLTDFCNKKGYKVLESPTVLPHDQHDNLGLWETGDDYHEYVHTEGNGYNEKIYTALHNRAPIFEPADMFKATGPTSSGKQRIYCMASVVSNCTYHEWFQKKFPSIEFVPFKRYFYSDMDLPMHVDASYVPLDATTIMCAPEQMPGPETMRLLQEQYRILIPPRSDMENPTSRRFHLNTLNLDEKRMFINAKEKTMIKWLESYGYKPIPMEIANMNNLGGGFHCTTVDLERDEVQTATKIS